MSDQMKIFDVLKGGRQSVLTTAGVAPVYSLLVDNDLVNTVTGIVGDLLQKNHPIRDQDVVEFAKGLVHELNRRMVQGRWVYGRISSVAVTTTRGEASVRSLQLIGHIHVTEKDQSVTLDIDDNITGFGSLNS